PAQGACITRQITLTNRMGGCFSTFQREIRDVSRRSVLTMKRVERLSYMFSIKLLWTEPAEMHLPDHHGLRRSPGTEYLMAAAFAWSSTNGTNPSKPSSLAWTTRLSNESVAGMTTSADLWKRNKLSKIRNSWCRPESAPKCC